MLSCIMEAWSAGRWFSSMKCTSETPRYCNVFCVQWPIQNLFQVLVMKSILGIICTYVLESFYVPWCALSILHIASLVYAYWMKVVCSEMYVVAACWRILQLNRAVTQMLVWRSKYMQMVAVGSWLWIAVRTKTQPIILLPLGSC